MGNPQELPSLPPSSPCPAGAAPQAGPSYIEAFLTVLKNVTKDETVQYVLALLEQMLAGPGMPRSHTAFCCAHVC